MDKKLFGKLVDSIREVNEVAAGRRKPSRTFRVDARRLKKDQRPGLPQVVGPLRRNRGI
jgi:putative transcriptional regulator